MIEVIKEKAATFNNVKIYSHWHHETKRPDGRYIKICGIFQLGVPILKRPQFLGLHKHLFATIDYPVYVRDLLGVASDLPAIPGIGSIAWVNAGNLATDKRCKGLWVWIRANAWTFNGAVDKTSPVKTSAFIRVVKGEGGGRYYLLEFPLLTRGYFAGKYKKSFQRKVLKAKKERKERKDDKRERVSTEDYQGSLC